MAFAIQQHVAPRIIKLKNFLGSPIEVYSSIIAGCRQSIPMTRVYLQRGIDNVTNNSNKELEVNPSALDGVSPNKYLELARSQLYVDDCAQTFRHSNGGVVHNHLCNSFYLFDKVNRRLKLTLSAKGVIVANCPKLAKRLQSELLHLHGTRYEIKQHTRDLGISYTAGKYKPNQLFNSRFLGRKGRINKIGKLARMHRNARNLYKGSGFSASTWGHQVCGFTRSNLELLERHGAKCTGITPAGRCRYSANCVAYGQYGHPKARIIRETPGTFFQLTFEMIRNHQESDLRYAWMEAKSQHAKVGAACIKGPLSE